MTPTQKATAHFIDCHLNCFSQKQWPCRVRSIDIADSRIADYIQQSFQVEKIFLYAKSEYSLIFNDFLKIIGLIFGITCYHVCI